MREPGLGSLPFGSTIGWGFVLSPEVKSFSAREGGLKAEAERNWKPRPRTCSPHCLVSRSRQAAGDFCARLKITRQSRGQPLDENDLWIAATALAINATLVS